MRLKQVRLDGFKSFCDSSEFTFKPNGITMVVGPNGCGKSNVVDAVRWALGEQSPKTMRGGSMSDVIFSGSSSRKPVGRAEVTLLFDNSQRTALEKYNEFNEISVTRRLYRSGESEYLINKFPCRLLDIRELVMDTGVAGRSYSIVEQGRVEEFISASPAERRAYMEEAAGIVRYKTKRVAAEKKLEQTRQNLLRVEDVLGELNRQEGQLRQQMETAREFRGLQSEVASLHGALVRFRHDASLEICTGMEAQLQALREEASELEQAMAALLADQEGLSVEQTRGEQHLRESRGAIYQQEQAIQRDETTLALQQQSLENVRAWYKQLEQTRGDLTRRGEELSALLTQHREEAAALAEKEETLCQDSVRLENLHQERQGEAKVFSEKLTNWRDELLECETHLSGIETQQRFLEERLAEDERRELGLAERIRGFTAELETARADLKARRAKAVEADATLAASQERLRGMNAMLAAGEEALAAHREAAAACERERMECRSRLETLEDIEAGYEGFGEAVRAFLTWADEHPEQRKALGIVGPLANLMTVPGDVAEWAGDFLAPHLELIVVERSEALPGLAGQLETLGLGGIAFLPLDALASLLPAREAGSGGSGDTRETLAGLLSGAAGSKTIVDHLFGATILLPDGAPHEVLSQRVLSQQGLAQPMGGGREWLSRDGSVHVDALARVTLGHAAEPGAGILRRRAEIAALTAETEKRDLRWKTLQDEGAVLTGKIENLREQKADEEALLAERTLGCKEMEQEIGHGNREAERLEQAMELAVAEAGHFHQELERCRAQQNDLKADTVKWRETRERLQQGLAGLRKEEEQARQRLEDVSNTLTDSKVEHSRVLSQLESRRARLEDLELENEATHAKLTETGTGVERQEEKEKNALNAIAGLTNGLDAHHQALDGLRAVERERREAFDKLAGAQRAIGEKVGRTRTRFETCQGRVHKLEMVLAQERTRLEQFAGELAALPQAPEPVESGEEKDMEKRLLSARSRLQRMEGVNLGAPEEYEALEERMLFLSGQKSDLESSIENLESSIRRMNTESRRRFRETFEAVNKIFQRIFPEVFTGGEARLVLTDSDDPLLAGVEIVAQPPGKKLQSI
ncbi:MAG: chromosome segregation protein SMC, partial [bacterium]